MSSCKKIKITCPDCGQKIDYDYWESVNVDINPELKNAVLNKDIFRCHCPCGCNDVILHSFLYHNMKNKYMISFCDLTEVEDVKSSFEESDKMVSLGERFRITTDFDDFKDKVNILDSGFDDKLIEIQRFIAYEALKKKGVKYKTSFFTGPNKNCKEYHFTILDLSDNNDNCYFFPIQKDWFEKHTQLINSKEKYIDDVFYVIDQAWADLIAGSGHYQGKNGLSRILKSYQNDVKRKYKIDYDIQDINMIDDDDNTLLKLAVIADDYDRVKELLENGADPNLQPEKGRNSLHYALEYGVSKEIVELLIEYGVDINACSKRGPKPLDLITPHCSVEYLDYVMSLGAECDKDELIRSFASKTNNIEIIDYLVEKGFSLSERNSYDMNITAEVLCNNEDNIFLNQYLDKYGTPNEKYNGKPCLFNELDGYDNIRRTNGYYAKRLQILFDHGADVNITNSDNITPMMIACEFAHDEHTIRFLLKYNPDLLATDTDGHDIFYYLDKNEYLSEMEKERIRLLLSA